jgi:hypothetical protein
MHVKDYLQALADDNKIRVEKIGSGNWYWSFLSDEKKAKDSALEKAQDEFNKINATVAELQAKVDEAGAARAEDEDILMETGDCLHYVCLLFANDSRWRSQDTHHQTYGPHQRAREAAH